MRSICPPALLPLLLASTMVVLTGCENHRSPAPTAAAPIATAPDKSPIIAALTHFRSLPDLWIPNSVNPQGVLLVDRSYATTKGFISATQLSADLHGEWSVPEDARLDMERRTDARERFALQKGNLPAFIRLQDFESDPPGNYFDFAKRSPEARCSISLWPPGYTADRQRAVIRFTFGPTPHGASAVYLLERRADGLWHALKHGVAYYA